MGKFVNVRQTEQMPATREFRTRKVLLALDFEDFSGSSQLEPSHHGALIEQGPTSEHGKLQLSGMVTPKANTISTRTSSSYRVRDVRDVVHRRDLFKVADVV